MKQHTHVRAPKRIIGAAVIAVLAVTACGGGSGNAAKPTPASAPGSGSGSLPASSSAPSGPSYSTRFFSVPFDLALPAFLDPTPSGEEPNFVTWGSSDGSVAARFLRPVVVFPPGSTDSTTLPADFVAYLLGQTDHGAHFADREDTTVDGHKTIIVTGTTDQSLDGSLGCPGTGIEADACFGLQPEFSLRVAVIATDTGPLLIWLRSSVDASADVTASHQRLDQLLAGFHFATRAVETAAAATNDTEYDGVYTWTITKEDALAHGTPSDQTPEGLAVFPNTFTATLKNGRVHITETSTRDVEDDPYEASPGHLLLGDHTTGLSATVTRDPDGTLHLTAVPPILDAGGVFICTTEPWVPVAG